LSAVWSSHPADRPDRKTHRWNLEQFLEFLRKREGGLARVSDLMASTIQERRNDMASADLALTTMRGRELTLSSLCYRCGFAKTKGPAVCPHGPGYRQERIEGALLAKFREAITDPLPIGLTPNGPMGSVARWAGPIFPSP
jgi:hypothetical protein